MPLSEGTAVVAVAVLQYVVNVLAAMAIVNSDIEPIPVALGSCVVALVGLRAASWAGVFSHPSFDPLKLRLIFPVIFAGVAAKCIVWIWLSEPGSGDVWVARAFVIPWMLVLVWESAIERHSSAAAPCILLVALGLASYAFGDHEVRRSLAKIGAAVCAGLASAARTTGIKKGFDTVTDSVPSLLFHFAAGTALTLAIATPSLLKADDAWHAHASVWRVIVASCLGAASLSLAFVQIRQIGAVSHAIARAPESIATLLVIAAVHKTDDLRVSQLIGFFLVGFGALFYAVLGARRKLASARAADEEPVSLPRPR